MATVVAYLYHLSQQPPTFLPWHETDGWIDFLKVYDRVAQQVYPGCKVYQIPTKWGLTHSYACGNPNNPALLMLYGAEGSSLDWGEWLVPTLSRDYYAIAIDYPCDTGRSIPNNRNAENCPSTEESQAEWVQDVVKGLKTSAHYKNTRPVSLIGYSYGTYQAFVTPLHYPDLIDKIILWAPGAVFADVSMFFIDKAIMSAFSESNYRKLFAYMAEDEHCVMEDFYSKDDTDLINTMKHIGNLNMNRADTISAHSPQDLQKVCSRKKAACFSGIGDKDVVSDPAMAAHNALEAGAEVHVYTNATHLMYRETEFMNQIEKDVLNFLKLPTDD